MGDPTTYSFMNEQLDAVSAINMTNMPVGYGTPISREESVGSIFIRTAWRTRTGISGLAIVPPQPAATPRNRLALLTDDSTPPSVQAPNNQGQVPSDSLAPVVKDIQSIHTRFELFRPFVFTPAAQRGANPAAQLILLHGTTTSRVEVIDVDFATETALIRDVPDPALGDTAAVPQSVQTKFSALLRAIDLPATGALAWDGLTPRLLNQPPEGVTFPFPPPPPPGPPPRPPGVIVDLAGPDGAANPFLWRRRVGTRGWSPPWGAHKMAAMGAASLR